MCGVVGGVGDPVDAAVAALRHRGPDAIGVVRVGPFWLGHTRLAILDLDSRSDQPFSRGDVTVSYNGELWNYLGLRAELESLGESFCTDGDTEVVAAVLDRWGVAGLSRMEGMFAVAWADGETLRLARDRFGEVPLHVARVGGRVAFASEIRAVAAAGLPPAAATWVEPGTVVEIDGSGGMSVERWYDAPAAPAETTLDSAAERMRMEIASGVAERSISDVPVCALLSGGIDSSSVLSHLVSHVPDVVAFVAYRDPKSPDLLAAREVADRLGTELREIAVPAPTADDLSDVVRRIEMPHKAQVEIGWACLHLARSMSADGFKVTFSGEGADELMASYGFSYHGVHKFGWHAYRKRTFLDQHRKNFARCNKVFLSHGVECRLPFLHTSLVEFALSLPQSAVASRGRPKAVMSRAYSGLLPDRVVHRPKLAFQDGAGLKGAAAAAVGDPRRYYAAEFKRLVGGPK